MDFEVSGRTVGVRPRKKNGPIVNPKSKWAIRMTRSRELKELGYCGTGSPKKPIEKLNVNYRAHIANVAKYGKRTVQEAAQDRRGIDLRYLYTDMFSGVQELVLEDELAKHPILGGGLGLDMNFSDRAAIIGMLLGDACITNKYTKLVDGSMGKSATFCCTHSIKQLPYCQHKANRITQALGGRTKVFFTEAVLKGRGKPYRQCRFEKSNKYLGQLKDWIYTNGKKEITQRILDWLTDEGFAYWFLDDGWSEWWRTVDGAITSCQSGLALCRPIHECDLVLGWLEQRYGVTGRIATVNKQNMLKFKTQDSIRLHAVVRPFTPKSMLYKVDANYAPHERPTPICEIG